MTILALTTGTLFRNPETRVSKNGRAFSTATLKFKEGDGVAFVKLLVFQEAAQAELSRLHEGDALSAQGQLKAETYVAKDGETRISLTIIADQLLPLRAEKKARPKSEEPERRPAQSRTEPRPLDRHAGDGRDEFGDTVPF
jgi:single-stranded DNA-binding protein